MAAQDITGKKWHRMTAIRFAAWKVWSSGKRDPIWLWKCDCGNEKEALATNVKSGGVRSCGCYLSERMREVHTKHGAAQEGKVSRMYRIFMGIKTRCENPNSPNYKYYGVRGIKCLWMSYEDFERDMGPTYQDHLTIGRIDNDGDYCKSNCRWETYAQQSVNKSSNRVLDLNGKSQTLSEWAKELNIPNTTIISRLDDLDWSVEKALTKPVRYKTPNKV